MHSSTYNGLHDVLLKSLEINPELATIQNNKGENFLLIALRKNYFDIVAKANEIKPELLLVKNGNKYDIANHEMKNATKVDDPLTRILKTRKEKLYKDN